MIPALTALRPAIAELCRRYHVRRLDVFGSAARAVDFSDRSDIDFAVAFEPDHTPPDFGAFLAFQNDLSALLGRPVDLVIDGAARNPYLRESMERSRQTVHGA